MDAFRALMGLTNTAVTVYSLVLFVRIILTWFPNMRFGRLYRILSGMTDPYLALFRRIRFFRIGNMDFSPIAGFMLLAVAANLTMALSRAGAISAGLLAYIALSVITSAFSFLMGIFALITGMRFIGYLSNADTYHSPAWRALDTVSAPIIYGVTRLFFRRRVVRYRTSLIVTLLTLGGGIALASVLMSLAKRALVG